MSAVWPNPCGHPRANRSRFAFAAACHERSSIHCTDGNRDRPVLGDSRRRGPASGSGMGRRRRLLLFMPPRSVASAERRSAPGRSTARPAAGPGGRWVSVGGPRQCHGKQRTSIGAARAQAGPEVTGAARGGPSASLGRAPFPPGEDTGRSTAGAGEGLRVLPPPGVCLDECSRLTLLRAGGGSLGLRGESAGSLRPVSPAPPRRCHRGLDAKSAGMMDQAGRAVPPCTG